MTYIIVALASFLVAGFTFFSGFGLGTLLLPLFVLFFPVPVAVAATPVVHQANNVFKVARGGKNADLRTVFLFGVPAAFAAVGGAWLLGRLAGMPELLNYTI
ncbi:MAG: TSUP family transporter, partial [Candidatus Latescibacterota bacterium]